MIVLGIDPGLSGAFARIDNEGWLQVTDIPTLSLVRGGKRKREIDAAILADYLSSGANDHAFVELVGAMPDQGVSSVFAFGRSYGVIIGILATLDIPVTFVSPAKWKRLLNVPAAKDGARARASQLLPAHAENWKRAKDDGRAEAALIALYGLRTLCAS